MNILQITGALLILLPIAFNVIFFMLQREFEYPNILRKPTGHVLERFQAGGPRLVGWWYAFAMTSVIFIAVAILAPLALVPDDRLLVALATAAGVLAGLLQCLGLIRWPFVVPHLARTYADPASGPAKREAASVVFEALHRYAGAAIGEHLGYLFTGLWTIALVAALTRPGPVPAWLGWAGLIPAAGILVGLLEEAGFKAAGAINATAYIVWSVWLIAAGIFMLI